MKDVLMRKVFSKRISAKALSPKAGQWRLKVPFLIKWVLSIFFLLGMTPKAAHGHARDGSQYYKNLLQNKVKRHKPTLCLNVLQKKKQSARAVKNENKRNSPSQSYESSTFFSYSIHEAPWKAMIKLTEIVEPYWTPSEDLKSFNSILQSMIWERLEVFLRGHPNFTSQIAISLKKIEIGSKNGPPEHLGEVITGMKLLAQLQRNIFWKLESPVEQEKPVNPARFKVVQIENFAFDGELSKLEFLDYPVKFDLWNNGIDVWQRRELEIDEVTNVIRGQNPTGRALIEQLIEQAKIDFQKGDPWTFIFLDLNNLGLVNYFWGGPPVGDAFLKSFASRVQTLLKKDDYFFRVGGDEFLILTHNRNKMKVSVLMHTLMGHFYNDPDANALLDRQWIQTARAIEMVETFSNYEELLRSSFSDIVKNPWKEEARQDFASFKENYQKIYRSELRKNLRRQMFLMKPTFTAGAKIIHPHDTLSSLTAAANHQSQLSKRLYKEEQGASATKLGGSEANLEVIEQNVIDNKVIIPTFLEIID